MQADAAKITRRSKSNLALAFVSLGKERRRDMEIFYAFCRVIDDIADEINRPVAEKQAGLNAWRRWIRKPGADEPGLAAGVRALLTKYRLPPEMLGEVIAGVEMDLHKSRYASFEELRVYCYRVASAVGLVSIEIFGYRDQGCKDYAVALGLALQTTNIIRDVAKDLAEFGRIYLPQDELARFGYAEDDLRRRVYDRRFVALMDFQAERSMDFFRQAAGLLPQVDRRSMVAAEIMASVYRGLLGRMRRDGFRVFEKDYRLNRWQKAGRIAGQLWRSF